MARRHRHARGEGGGCAAASAAASCSRFPCGSSSRGSTTLMLCLASSTAFAGYSAAASYCTAVGDPFARPQPLTREYDEKALVEMYRAVLKRGEAAPVIAAARLPGLV